MKKIISFPMLVLCLLTGTLGVFAQNKEYGGQFERTLAANTEDFEKVIFKKTPAGAFKADNSFSDTARVSVNRLYHPQTGKFSVLAMLVEEEKADAKPLLFVDFNGDNNFSADEKIVLQTEEDENPYLWSATVNLPVKDSFFTAAPIFVRYFKQVQIDGMSAGDRLITQSTEVMARGEIPVGDKNIGVQYAFDFADSTVNPKKGWLGVDGNEDGKIDMDPLSPEAANANDEEVIFRVGQLYVSTKKADLAKNQIVLRGRDAKEYKRRELAVGKEFGDFSFVDLTGKKRQFSEFRGKYVLLDIWGVWCPACRKELPYLREAAKRFKSRNLEVVGLNTDPAPPAQVKQVLDQNDIKWTQAGLESVFELLSGELRISSFPTTFLISPEGKIISMSRSDRDEPDLRGADLLETLDGILPK